MNSSFFNTNSVGKTSCFFVYRSLFLFMFFFHLFFLWFFVCCFSISFATCFPLKMSSLPLYFLFLFILFPAVLSFLSPLVFSLLSPILLFKTSFFLVFLLSLCFFMSNSLWKNIFLNFCETIFFFFSPQKTSFSLFPFLLVFFTCFSMFGLFLCLEKWFLVFYISPFFDSSFQLCCSFFLLVDVSKNKNVFFVVKCGKTLFCFLFLFSWFKKHFWGTKSVLFFHYFWNFF